MLERSGKGAGGEYQLTDAIKMLLKEEPVWGYRYRGNRLDCGTVEGWLDATIRMALKDENLKGVVKKALG
jgi:UTP--glucose-1-phosphate uridylyltransferase